MVFRLSAYFEPAVAIRGKPVSIGASIGLGSGGLVRVWREGMKQSGKYGKPDDRPGTGLEQRLESLEARLNQRRPDEEKAGKGSKPVDSRSGFATALRLSSGFISAILVGAGIGYLIDTFVGTRPWGMIVFLMIGFAAGIVNVLRSSGELSDPYRSVWAPDEKDTNGNSPGGRPDEKKE